MSRPLPHDVHAEEALLGALLLGGTTDPVVITPDDFSRESHGIIFVAIQTLHEAVTPPDQITVAERLERDGTLARVGGRARLIECVEACPLASRARHYAALVAELAARRRLIRLAVDLATRSYDEVDLCCLIRDIRGMLATELEIIAIERPVPAGTRIER
ncbi:MAG: hypothetical protein IBX63_10490 [Coriobacteriia bacterium]|nr:hypothetical protein [Coriobacteriia bacterium]